MFDDVCSLLWSSCSANCPFNQICIWVFGCRFVSDNGHRISQVFLWSWIFVELFWSVFVHHQHCYLAENNSCKNAGGWRGLRGFGASKAFNQKRCIIIAWSWKPMVSKRPLIWKRPIGIGGKNPRGIGFFPRGSLIPMRLTSSWPSLLRMVPLHLPSYCVLSAWLGWPECSENSGSKWQVCPIKLSHTFLYIYGWSCMPFW